MRLYGKTLIDGLSVVCFGALVLLVLATYTDYGTSWDEHEHIRYGDDIVEYFRSGMSVAAVPDHHQSYGGGFNLAAAGFSKMVAHPRYVANHLFNALVGLLGLMGTWRLGRLLGGAASGFVSLALLAALPAYYGHMFNNPKDVPFAAGYVWMLYCLCRLIQAGPRAGLRVWLALGLAMGLTMSVRVGGLVGFGYLAVIVTAQWLAERRAGSSLRLLGALAWKSALVAVLAWGLMILPWPHAHRAPIRGPLEALGRFSAHSFDTRTLFRGRFVPSDPPPWGYLPEYLWVQVPELLWFLLGAGLVALAVMLAKRTERRAMFHWRGGALLLVGLAIVFPIAFAILRGSTVYDGLRHFVFVLPLLCVLGGVSAVTVVGWLGSRSRVAALSAAGVLVFGWSVVVADMVELHPYQYVYFNRMSGGLPAAADRYETDYYAHSFKELGEALADHLWHTNRARYLDSDFQILACGIVGPLLEKHIPPNFTVRREPPLLWRPHPYDFYVAYRRLGCIDRRQNLPLVVTVERQGVLLNVARDMRGPAGKSRP